MKLFLRINSLIILVLLLSSCTEKCDDCGDLTTKNVVYTDSLGNNIFFGDRAVLNPDSVYFQLNDSEPMPAAQNINKGSFSFFLSENYEKYIFILPNSTIDTLEFNVSQQKSKDCCGFKPKSTRTFLNSSEIQNTDPIMIVKDF